MLTNQSFTDPQGQSYTEAVVQIRKGYRTTNAQSDSMEEIKLSTPFSEPLTINQNNNESIRDEVVVSFAYWPTQAAYDSGYQYYQLINVATENSNRFDEFIIDKQELQKDKYENKSFEEVCLTYFSDEILPTLTSNN